MDHNPKPLRVLTLDGGGMRGTYTSTYLERLAGAFAARRGVKALDIGAAFDLIVGTSTGGIVACALAAGVPLAQITALYIEHGTRIFRRQLPTHVVSLVGDLRRRAGALAEGTTALRQALENSFGQVTLGEIYATRSIGLAIPATEMGQHRAWVFKTPHLNETTSHRDDHYSLVDVCLATTAAPIYRSMAVVEHPPVGGSGYNVFVDGGLWANNPVLVGLLDALEMTAPDREIQIFSLGTCPLPAGEFVHRSDVHRGLWDWRFGGEAASLAIDAQQFAFDHMAKKLARHVDRRCTVIRFPSEKIPAALSPYLGLDDTRDEAIRALIDQARTDADMANSKCAYADMDREAELICALFNSMPKRIYPSNDPSSPDKASGPTGSSAGAQPRFSR